MVFFVSSRRRHTRCSRDWSSDVCSSDLTKQSVLALTQASGRISFSTVPVHLVVVLHQECALSRPFLRWGNLRRAPTQRSSIPTRHYGLGPEPLHNCPDPLPSDFQFQLLTFNGGPLFSDTLFSDT